MIYNKTCLFSATAGTDSITLSEPLSAFERYVVKVNPGVYWESVCTADRSVQRFNRYGSYNNDGYMEWPANWVISNGTQSMNCNRFQLLMQQGTTTSTRLFGFNNTASNVKNIMEVWGINRKDYTTAQGEGKPEGDWKAYNETLLWSGTDYANQSHITLNDRAIGYERLKVGVGSFGESTNIYEVDTPQTYTSWLPLRSYWGTTTGSFYLSMHRYQWDNETSGLSAVSGKTWQLGTASANPYTTTGNYTATDAYVRRPVWAIWGINKKPTHTLTLINGDHGNIAASRITGVENDEVTLSNTPDEDWYFAGYNITGATLTSNKFKFGKSDVTAEGTWTQDAYTITYENDGNGTLTGNSNTALFGDVITLTATPNTNYALSGYAITGATLTGNQFTVENTDVTAYAAFSAVPQSALYWSTTASNTAGSRASNTKTISKAVTEFNYFTLKFQHQASHSTSVWADYINVNFNTGSWSMRAHYQAGNYKPVRNGSTFTAANSNVATRTQDGNSLRYYKSIADTTNATYKFVVDRSAARCSAFLNNTYLGYGTVNSNITAVNNVQIGNEQTGGVTAKQYYLAGFKNLSDAAAY